MNPFLVSWLLNFLRVRHDFCMRNYMPVALRCLSVIAWRRRMSVGTFMRAPVLRSRCSRSGLRCVSQRPLA
jgi:hypothetical protein